jgi:putative ABC transport system substrate-binding protein
MRTRRRLLVVGSLGVIAPAFTLSQPRTVKVGILLARPLAQSFYGPVIVERLGELGYREGSSMQLEHRSADGVADRFPKLARELIEAKCNLIFAVGPEQPVRALQSAGSSVPVVFVAVDYDPVEKGVVTSLSRPDRNTTGVYVPQGQLAAKRLEIMREVLPAARRFLVLSDLFSRDQLPAVRNAAESAGVQLTVIEFTKPPYDLVGAFETARQARVDALIGLTSPVTATRASELAELLAKHKLPGAGWPSAIGRSGFLFGYGDDPPKVSRRAAEIGARILKGVKPADIPVEQANEFEFVINSAIARSLRVKIPESVMARATRIVQ